MKNSRNATALLTRGFRSFLDLLYPRRCPLCQEILKDKHQLICPECAGELRPVTEPRCFLCGKPVKENEEYCRDCKSRPRAFTQGRGIFLYDEKMKASLLKYKYYGHREYGRFYAKAMYLYAKNDLRKWKPDIIVPVPLHWKKQRMRGFNQAAYLVEEFSRYTGIPADCTLVKKIHSTKSQKNWMQPDAGRTCRMHFRSREGYQGRKSW